MEYLLLGFLTSLSLILAIGAQNIFVIEQGLKKQYIFTVCLICSVSDGLLIFLGLFLFHYFNQYFNCSLHFEKEYFPGFGTFYNITFYNHKGICHNLEGSSRRSFKRAFKDVMKKLNKNFQEVIFK